MRYLLMAALAPLVAPGNLTYVQTILSTTHRGMRIIRCTLTETDGSMEEASAWIVELTGYLARAGLEVRFPLTIGHVAKLEARKDALAQPPTRSLSPNGFGAANGNPDPEA